ncbi:50S ribosomal protein L2 [Candidatus Pacearchaeota archaeon]|nr:50S ribosomal protein L2 [Candidatus Pacearchaeota archaeon]
MGKRIISQARGKGSLSYQARKQAFIYRVGYPIVSGQAQIIKVLHSAAHSAPLIKVKMGKIIFFNVAHSGALLGSDISLGVEKIADGNILALKHIPIATKIFNIEVNPGDGGKMIRTSGSKAIVYKKYDDGRVGITMPNRNEVKLDGECRATIGIVAGDGRTLKPMMKAGVHHYRAKARNKLWPKVSAVATNAVDHPFGSGRGKRIKSKTAKRNAPPGRKVGHIRPSRTGRKKR